MACTRRSKNMKNLGHPYSFLRGWRFGCVFVFVFTAGAKKRSAVKQIHAVSDAADFAVALADAQEMECANWSSLQADYCLLNRGPFAEQGHEVGYSTAGNSSGGASGVRASVVSGGAAANTSVQSPAVELIQSCSEGDAKQNAAVRDAKPSTAPGSKIQGIVAGVGSQRLLLKVNLGDPRLVAIADFANASACLHRSRKLSACCRLLLQLFVR